MTAATAPAFRDRPPRWGMYWVTWRQHRAALAAVTVALAGCAAYLLATGLSMRAGAHALGLDRCASTATDTCSALRSTFGAENERWYLVEYLLALLPGLVGMFVGAPLFAREYETGTFRFAWTQGTGRLRWAATKMVLLALALTALAQAFGLVYAWWREPTTRLDGIAGTVFELDGVAFATHTLFAFALGTMLGALLRRTVPALVGTFAAGLGAVIAVQALLLPRVMPPVVTRADATLPEHTGPGFEVDAWWSDRGGRRISQDSYNALASQLNRQGHEARGYLLAHGYHYWYSYQPVSRYWALSGVEAAVLCGLAVLCGAVTLALLRRRRTA